MHVFEMFEIKSFDEHSEHDSKDVFILVNFIYFLLKIGCVRCSSRIIFKY